MQSMVNDIPRRNARIPTIIYGRALFIRIRLPNGISTDTAGIAISMPDKVTDNTEIKATQTAEARTAVAAVRLRARTSLIDSLLFSISIS